MHPGYTVHFNHSRKVWKHVRVLREKGDYSGDEWHWSELLWQLDGQMLEMKQKQNTDFITSIMPLFETISVDENHIRDLVDKHYGLKLGTLLKSSQNNTYLATKSEDGTETKFIVRATPDPKNERLPAIQLEIALLNDLYSQGLTVCPPIKNHASQYHVVSDTPTGPLIVVVFQHALGSPVDFLSWRWLHEKKFAVSLGRWMAKFHQLSRQFCQKNPQLLKDARPWTALHDGVLKEVPVTEEDQKLSQSPQSYGLIHGDVNVSNFFFDEDTDTVHMFDWDQLQTCWYGYDLSAPIWTSVACKEGGNPLDSTQAVPNCDPQVYTDWFLEGYEENGEKMDREHLKRMIGLRRQLYKRFSARAMIELPEDHPMAAFCRHMDSWLGKEE
ncbi:hypothetical protein PROFUN_01525 [Planoprotostelium fungivorum]|uniref:Aminoglycoside phosphotransferase domain-containing protein n=1 Tax=Planoprotostelium fungivorum TaxID=1890364 RepID=A0A2P6NTG5_9EUKA|nr:hypothetical protein PROFUN_01525 [Planoprotostelium fungivorum]